MDEYLDDIEKELAEHWALPGPTSAIAATFHGGPTVIGNWVQFSDKCARLRDLRDRIVGILGQYGEDY